MRFLTDQDVYRITVEFLRRLGHDVLTASEAGLSRASDEEILRFATQEGRVLVTRDKGFGALVFLEERGNPGVILLQIEPSTVEAIHRELQRFITSHAEMDMSRRFVVIEPGRHRIRTSAG